MSLSFQVLTRRLLPRQISPGCFNSGASGRCCSRELPVCFISAGRSISDMLSSVCCRNKTVSQIRSTRPLNPQLYCKTASWSSKQSGLLLSGYTESPWIKGIAPPSSLTLAFTSWQLIDVANPTSPLFTFQQGYPGNGAAAIFGPSLRKPLSQIKSQHGSSAFLSWCSLLGAR